MKESNGIIVKYFSYMDKPTTGGTFSYGDTIVITLPNPEYISSTTLYQTKTTHTLPNGDVISIG